MMTWDLNKKSYDKSSPKPVAFYIRVVSKEMMK